MRKSKFEFRIFGNVRKSFWHQVWVLVTLGWCQHGSLGFYRYSGFRWEGQELKTSLSLSLSLSVSLFDTGAHTHTSLCCMNASHPAQTHTHTHTHALFLPSSQASFSTQVLSLSPGTHAHTHAHPPTQTHTHTLQVWGISHPDFIGVTLLWGWCGAIKIKSSSRRRDEAPTLKIKIPFIFCLSKEFFGQFLVPPTKVKGSNTGP